MIEWSAPRDALVDDVDAWRQASPYWTAQRERVISRRLEALRSGEVEDPEEPDPIESFRAQWMNVWPEARMEPPGAVQDLLAPGLWVDLEVPGLWSDGPVFVGLEDDFGLGAAVACAALLEDGRIEVDGWLRDDWDTAVDDVVSVHGHRRIRELHVGASLLSRLPTDVGLPRARPAGGKEAKVGLALLRDLAAGGALVHDETTGELDGAVAQARVKESLAGLHLIASGPTHLVRALSWAVAAAHRPARVLAVR